MFCQPFPRTLLNINIFGKNLQNIVLYKTGKFRVCRCYKSREIVVTILEKIYILREWPMKIQCCIQSHIELVQN